MRNVLIALVIIAGLMTVGHADEDRKPTFTLESPLVSTAKLAEYLTSCGGKAKPEIELVAQRIIDRIGNQKWLETVSPFHVERDESSLKKFCSEMRVELSGLLELDYLPGDTPPPGDLDLTPPAPSRP
jgi:hypothetical protein